jgi:hypothetical protein
MMIAMTISMAILAAMAWILAPKGVVIHAARHRKFRFRHRRFPFAALYRDPEGNSIDFSNRIIGQINGDSCREYGLRDGNVVIAEKLDDIGRQGIEPGNLVIINSLLDSGEASLRMRKIKAICEGMMDFYDDPYGKEKEEPLKKKPLADAFAKLEFVAVS